MGSRFIAGMVAFSIVTALLLAGGPYAGTAHACSCAGSQGVAAAYRNADAVFAGEMVRGGLEDPDPEDRTMIGGIEFRVIEAWKGVSGNSAVMYGQDMAYYGEVEEGEMVMASSCAYVFDRGERYLIYAHRYEDGFRTDVCTRTTGLENAGEDLRALGSPTISLPDTGGAPLSVAGIAAAAALLMAGGLLAGRVGGGDR